MILIDTNVLSELMRPNGSAAVVAWFESARRARVATTAVTEAEILFGLARMPDGARRRFLAAAVRKLFDIDLRGRVLPFDRAAARHYGTFFAARRAAGRLISVADGMIAAIALARGATAIATRNTPDFEGCGLPLIDPWQPQA